MDDTGIRLEPISREGFIQTPDATKIEFRLRIMDPKKRVNKHKENEAIQFDFDTKLDDFDEMSHEMCKSGLIFDEDVRPVSKLLKIQVQTLLKDRSERQTQIRLEKEQKQQKLLAEQRQKQFAEQLAAQQAAQQAAQVHAQVQAQVQAAVAQAQANQLSMQNMTTPTHQQQGTPNLGQIDPAQMLQWQQQQNILMQQNLAAVQQQQQQSIQNIPVNDVPGQISIEVPVLKTMQSPQVQQQQQQIPTQNPVQVPQMQQTTQSVPQQVSTQQQVPVQMPAPQPVATQQMPVQQQYVQQQQTPQTPAQQYVQVPVSQQQQQPTNVTPIPQQQQQKPLDMTPTNTGQQPPPARKISDQNMPVLAQQQQGQQQTNTSVPSEQQTKVQPGTGTSTPTTTGTATKRPSKSRRVNNSAERNPKLVVLSVEGGTLVECQMENKPKTITFKFDIIDVNPVDVAKNLVSTYGFCYF